MVDLVAYKTDGEHTWEHVERLVVLQPSGTKPTDPIRGVDRSNQMLDAAESCEFGLWTNGRDISYLR
jgi:hypothetical protein